MTDSSSDFANASKEELITRINKLEANVRQLRSIIRKRNLDEFNNLESSDDVKSHFKVKKQREFDFTRYSKRHIVLKFLYLGWDYHGYVIQEDTNNTIEDHLFAALIKTRLIESRATSNYHRCGRTDKGVSAYSQVISIDVRSKRQKGLGVIQQQNEFDNNDLNVLENSQLNDSDNKEDEIDYCGMLNKVLPDEIRCLAWAPVRSDFSARFDCKSRCYHYYFPKSTLNTDQMNKAGKHLIGSHDYTNFCKRDPSKKEANHVRTITEFSISPYDSNKSHENAYQIYVARISASGFLWHQIRCIMAILFLVGENKESPEIVKQLLDTKTINSKPQYTLASELPLVLFATEWDQNDVGKWNYSQTASIDLIKHLQSLWTNQAVKCHIIKGMIDDILREQLSPVSSFNSINQQHIILTNEHYSKLYKQILARPRCGNLKFDDDEDKR